MKLTCQGIEPCRFLTMDGVKAWAEIQKQRLSETNLSLQELETAASQIRELIRRAVVEEKVGNNDWDNQHLPALDGGELELACNLAPHYPSLSQLQPLPFFYPKPFSGYSKDVNLDHATMDQAPSPEVVRSAPTLWKCLFRIKETSNSENCKKISQKMLLLERDLYFQNITDSLAVTTFETHLAFSVRFKDLPHFAYCLNTLLFKLYPINNALPGQKVETMAQYVGYLCITENSERLNEFMAHDKQVSWPQDSCYEKAKKLSKAYFGNDFRLFLKLYSKCISSKSASERFHGVLIQNWLLDRVRAKFTLRLLKSSRYIPMVKLRKLLLLSGNEQIMDFLNRWGLSQNVRYYIGEKVTDNNIVLQGSGMLEDVIQVKVKSLKENVTVWHDVSIHPLSLTTLNLSLL